MGRTLHLLLFAFFLGGLCVAVYSTLCAFPSHLFMGFLDILIHLWCSFVTWRWYVRAKDPTFKFWKP